MRDYCLSTGRNPPDLLVCVVDTREYAEKLIKQYNKMKDDFKSRAGYIICLEPDITLNFEIKDDVYCNSHVKNIFLDIDDMKKNIEKIDDLQCYYEESNYFEFLSMKSSDDSLEFKLCRNVNSKLNIEEIDYIV